VLKVAVGEVVCHAGQRDDLFYVVLRGELFTLDAHGVPVPGGELYEGDSFGQVAALHGAAYAAAEAEPVAAVTTVAAGAATLLTVDRPTFNRTLRHHPTTLLLPATLRQVLNIRPLSRYTLFSLPSGNTRGSVVHAPLERR
jgi:CRP-like cAMP-binding protein